MRKLATADRMLNEGADVADVCRELQVSEQTYHRWRNRFGGTNAHDAKRLKDLERENATLTRLLADAEPEKAALREVSQGNQHVLVTGSGAGRDQRLDGGLRPPPATLLARLPGASCRHCSPHPPVSDSH